MLAFADHLAVIKYDDLICIHDRADPLCDDDTCRIRQLLFDVGSDILVSPVVEG